MAFSRMFGYTWDIMRAIVVYVLFTIIGFAATVPFFDMYRFYDSTIVNADALSTAGSPLNAGSADAAQQFTR